MSQHIPDGGEPELEGLAQEGVRGDPEVERGEGWEAGVPTDPPLGGTGQLGHGQQGYGADTDRESRGFRAKRVGSPKLDLTPEELVHLVHVAQGTGVVGVRCVREGYCSVSVQGPPKLDPAEDLFVAVVAQEEVPGREVEVGLDLDSETNTVGHA